MKNLWAPWRMTYIKEKDETNAVCIFDGGGATSSDRKSLLLRRDRLTVVLMNRFPYTNGHLLIAPARHINDLSDLTSEENMALMQILTQSVAILRRHYAPDGFNIGLNLGEAAGAGVADHLHFHIVPRWSGDHNFMTVLADIRTIPEHIERTFDQLLPDFQALQTDFPA
jgi:ATP adenylyltransferase